MLHRKDQSLTRLVACFNRRGPQTGYHANGAILDSSAIVENVLDNLFFSWEELHSAALLLTNKLTFVLVPANVVVKVILGVINRVPAAICTHYVLLVTSSCAYIVSFGKFGFRARTRLQKMSGSDEVWACDVGFGFQIEARLHSASSGSRQNAQLRRSSSGSAALN